MNLRFTAYFAAALFLTACQGLSNSQTSGFVPSQSLRAKSPAGKSAPKYGLAIVLPDGAIRPDSTSQVGSLKATTYIKSKRYVDIVENGTVGGCSLYTSGDKAMGCEVVYISTPTITIKKATFALYKDSKAKGCILAQAELKATTLSVNSPVASTFNVMNPKKCWK
jgi:hypothetical protein